MKPGGAVSYTDSKGKQHPATVTAIAGTGASGNKTLDLAVDDKVATDVPHKDDHEKGSGFWLLEDEVPAPVARRKKREK